MAGGAAEVSRLRGKKAIRAYARKLGEPDTIKDLNITPMMDMMTIILVFLLKTFTSETALITFDQNTQIPRSQSTLAPKQAINVTISKKVVVIEGEAIVAINNGKIDPTHKRDGENGYYVTPIGQYMDRLAKRERQVAELSGGKFEGELMVVADKSTPYRLLTEVLYSAGQSGYGNYRLLVLRNSD